MGITLIDEILPMWHMPTDKPIDESRADFVRPRGIFCHQVMLDRDPKDC